MKVVLPNPELDESILGLSALIGHLAIGQKKSREKIALLEAQIAEERRVLEVNDAKMKIVKTRFYERCTQLAERDPVEVRAE